MSELNNIDKLLKESFEGFAPDAPDVWQGIQQGVQAAQAGSTGAAAGAVKGGIGIVTKVVGVVAVSASLITGVILYNNSSKTEESVNTATTQTTAILEAPAPVEPQATSPIETPVETPIVATENPQPKPEETRPAKNNRSKQHQTSGTTEAMTTSAPVAIPQRSEEATTATTEPKTTAAADNTPAKATTAAATVNDNSPKAVIPARPQNTADPVANTKKEEAGDVAKRPYNPYAEDGEIYEKPFIPGSFSPNGDGLNERFVILIDNEMLYYLMILDRNGNVVFESDSKNSTWDGRDKRTGMVCEKGRYYYTFRFQFQGSTKQHQESGIIGVF
jgi:gliding motility-associated-like protein